MQGTQLILGVLALAVGTLSASVGSGSELAFVKQRALTGTSGSFVAENPGGSVSEYQRFKHEAQKRLGLMEERFVLLNSKAVDLKMEDQARYKSTLSKLERRNSDLGLKLEAYQESPRDNWRAFKSDFNHDLEKLETGLDKLSGSK